MLVQVAPGKWQQFIQAAKSELNDFSVPFEWSTIGINASYHLTMYTASYDIDDYYLITEYKVRKVG